MSRSPLAAVPSPVDDPIAALVADDHRWATSSGGVAVSPLEHRDQDRPEVNALLGEAVLEARRSLPVDALLEDPLVDEPGEPVGEDVAGDAEPILELVESPSAVEDVATSRQL